MKNNCTLFLLYVVCMITSCKKETTSPPAAVRLEPAKNLSYSDISNFGHAGDIEFSFLKPVDRNSISEFRAILVKAAEVANLDAASAATLEPGQFMTAALNQSPPYNFPPDLLDTSGELIKEEVNYQLIILSVPFDATVEVALSTPLPLKLEKKTAVRTIARIPNAGTGGMDVGPDGNIYMGNFGLNTNGGGAEVYRITPQGSISVFARGFQTASGNDFDRSGNLYQASFHGNAVFRIAPDGTKTELASGGQINGPVGLALDRNGELFVASFNTNAILKIDTSGVVTTVSRTNTLNGPNGLDFDTQGNLYVSNWNDGIITRIDVRTGKGETFAQVPSGNNAHLLIRNDVIYVVARFTNRIFRVSITGVVSEFIGTGSRGGKNGSAAEATLSYPNDIAFSRDGTKMYINHTDPSAIANTVLVPSIIREVDIVY